MSDTLDLRGLQQKAVAEVTAIQQNMSAETPSEREALTPREITFEIEYLAPDGKDRRGVIKSVVLTSDGRLAKARIFATLTSGVSVDSLSQEDFFRLDALARLTTQAKDVPDWLLDACGEDLELLVTVHNMLMEHENRYFRGNAKKGSEQAGPSRVRVTKSPFDEDASPVA